MSDGQLIQKPPNQFTSFWRGYGHSYMQYAFGTADQSGRIDSIFGAALDIERGVNWQNFAVNGAQLIKDQRSQGGWTRIANTIKPNPNRGGPYAPDGGGTLICYGINDLGFNGGGLTQTRNAFKEALRAIISRSRASTYRAVTHGSIAYSGWSSESPTDDFASTGTARVTTAGATGGTITITLPADYHGETVAIAFLAVNGATSGGTVTFSGTAGVTGTLSTTNVAVPFTHGYMIKRITNLTAANAGQTIIATVTAVGGGSAQMEFDGYWLEAANAGPVIVCNVARLTATGYTSNYAGWTGTEASRDADVQNLNSDITSIVGEFDSMVQIADLDSALTKGVDAATGFSLLFDGLHPNELGAAKCVDQILLAFRRCTRTTGYGETAHFNPPSPRSAGIKNPRISGNYYTWNRAVTTTPGPVVPNAGNQETYAFPFMVTGARERYTTISMKTGSTGGGTAGQFRWGLYDDPGWSGYPQCLYSEPTVGAAKSTGIVANTIISDSIAWPLDPGLYWIVFKWTVLPLTTNIVIAANQPPDASWTLPMIDNSLIYNAAASAPPCGWKLTAQGAGAFPGTFPSGATIKTVGTAVGTCVPLIALLLA